LTEKLSVGDRVEAPSGTGTIIRIKNYKGRTLYTVKLDEPWKGKRDPRSIYNPYGGGTILSTHPARVLKKIS